MAPSQKNSSPSPHNSNDGDPTPTSTRPKPYNAATVIPTLHTIQTDPSRSRSQRSRSKTNSTQPSTTTPDSRRRAGTVPHARPAALDLNLASLAIGPSISNRPANAFEIRPDRPSSPIPIPQRQKQKSPPTTPLTARAREPINYFGFHHGVKPRPIISESLTPCYSTGTRRAANSPPNPGDLIAQRGFPTMSPRQGSPLSGYMPTSPLSPKMAPQLLLNTKRQKERRPAKNMSLSGLPKFHPANFSSKDSSPTPLPPQTSRFVTSQPRALRGSDAQQKLHQYQRELIVSATQSSRSLLSEGLGAKPSPPRLTPLRSPVDPMTPLALEGQGDYLLAGSSSSPSESKNVNGREMIEQMVRRENERRRHPEARSGSSSPALSPALSPAVSPAGGC